MTDFSPLTHIRYSIQWCALAKSMMSTLQTSAAPLILDSNTIVANYQPRHVIHVIIFQKFQCSILASFDHWDAS